MELQVLELLNSSENDLKWFSSHYNELKKKFDEKFVAVTNNKLVAEGDSFEEVLKKVTDKKLNPANVLIRFVSKNMSMKLMG